MSITYLQKRQILAFMSEHGHWANVFDVDFFMDERRKWNSSRTNADISISSSPDRKSFLVIDEKDGGGSVALNTPEHGHLAITDESSRSVYVRKTQINTTEQTQIEISDISSAQEIGVGHENARLIAIPELAAYVRFYSDHSKVVFLEDQAKRISFGPPTAERDRSLHPGRFFHVVSFDLDTAAKWGLTPYGVLNGTKLIVSKDLSIEPDLKTFNELDPEKAAEYLSYLMHDEWDETFKGPVQWRPKKIKEVGDISHLQKKWADSTEFSGYFVGLPKQFFIEMTDDGFKLATSLDNREAIWSQTALLHEVTDGALNSATNLVRPGLSPRALLHILNKGQVLQDHRGREWNCAAIEIKNTAEIAQDARLIARRNFGLTGYHFAAVNFDENACFVAMDAEVLDKVSSAYNATVEMLQMAASGGRDKAQMQRLLDAGADLRLVKPNEAGSGRTIANEMKDAENYEMLADLQESGGVHDLTFDPNESQPDQQGPG